MTAAGGMKDGGGGGVGVGTATGIKVVIRIRPLLPRELMDDEVVSADETSCTVRVENDRSTMASSFDRVFGPRTTQDDVFKYAEPDIKQVLGGFNTTVFAYGQTGTGKTYTMLGGDYTGKHYKAISTDPDIRDGGGGRGSSEAFDMNDLAFGGLSSPSNVNSRASTPSSSSRPMSGKTRQQLAARGMIPRAVETLFGEIRSRYGDAATSSSSSSSCVVTCTYLEIYNENLYDLLEGSAASANWKKAAKKTKGHQPDPFDIRALQRRQTLEIKEDPSGGGGVYCPDLTSVKVTSANAVMALVRKGNRNRTVRQTEMNEHSSRSHTIIQLRVEQRTSGGVMGGGSGGGGGGMSDRGALVTAKLNLVDLAGSERWRDPEAMEGERLNEMTSINTSLSALASVIAALTDKRRTHVPYRDSKLTHLLQDSLGGNCRTTVIATVSPAAEAFEETCSTLKFADRTRQESRLFTPLHVKNTSELVVFFYFFLFFLIVL